MIIYIAEICKIQKGKKTFYARIDMELPSINGFMGYQCYKDTGDYIYSKWDNIKTLTFTKNEIVEIFKIDSAESL